MSNLERYFATFREHIIGSNCKIKTPYHEAIDLVYADWTASGRNYRPIEQGLQEKIMPIVANTHTETNHTGLAMTYAYHRARTIIKEHVHAGPNDVLISSNSGMTGVINKFQRILGLKIHESFHEQISIPHENRPIVFVSHMEHHSNQTSWLETIADMVIVPPCPKGLFSIENFKECLSKYKDRKIKIAAITSCSNVTGLNDTIS